MPSVKSMPNPSAVRTWAKEQGLEVGDRGRLSPAITEAYQEAHPGTKFKAAAAKPASTKAPVRAAKSSAPVKKAAVAKDTSVAELAPPVVAPVTPAIRVAEKAPVAEVSSKKAEPLAVVPSSEGSQIAELQATLALLTGRVTALESAAGSAKTRKFFGR